MSSVVDIVILGIDAFITSFLYRLYRNADEKARCVKNTPEYAISPGLPALIETAPDEKPYVCIRGIVKPEEEKDVLQSIHKPGIKGVIQTLLLREFRSKRRHGYWADDIRIIRDVTNTVPFVLVGNFAKVIVTGPLQANYLLSSLTVVHDQFQPSSVSFLDRICGDVTKGFQETEKMLPVATKMIGIGELVMKDGVLCLRAPSDGKTFIVTAFSKSEVVDRLRRTASTYKVLTGIFSAVGLIILYLIGKKYYQQWKSRRDFVTVAEGIRSNRRDASARFGGDSGSIDEDSMLCVICFSQPKEVVLLDCGHLCLCADCAESLPVPKKCPVCRQRVMRIIPTYIS